ncbi:MAG TPA: putative lipid II flippase FtsW [Vicinamibacterales bacterium]|jgi:cell division protein FtsW|nr:putative lipid II flippase FtsW [Vicinamibacterales bacterium]
MARKLKSDRVLFLTTILLVGMSVVMVYSASAPMALEKYGKASMFLVKQGMWALIGLAMLAVVMRIDYRTYREPVFIWTCLGIVAVALVGVLFSAPVNNARRWFGVGGIGVQPSELAKLSAIFFIAALLERRMHRIDDLAYALLPIGLVVILLVGLILLEPDFGTSMSLLLIATVMICAAGLDRRYILGAALAAVPAVYLLVMGTGYRRRRMLAFLNPWEDPLGDGFQIIQSLIAVGTGGLWGKGLMNGVQKLFYLPEPHTDFIYSVIAEELGLVGATIVLVCFCVVTWRGLRVALRAPDSFGAFLALGLTTMVAVQAFVNISVVLGLMPTKGIPLPFVSNGGSSLLINLVGMGILLNVSQHVTSEA